MPLRQSKQSSDKEKSAVDAILREMAKADSYGYRSGYSKADLRSVALTAVGSITNDEFSRIMQLLRTEAIKQGKAIGETNRVFWLKG